MLDFIFRKTVGEYSPEEHPLARALIDRLIAYASEPRFAEQLKAAREFYFAATGKSNEDDHDFNQRMNTFLEWFIFDYRPGGVGTHSLFDTFLNEKRKEVSSDDLVWWISVSRHQHSLFLVKSRDKGLIKVFDLWGRRNYMVTDDDTLEEGDILEARVIFHGKGCFFTYTHCLHPKEASKLIKKDLKKWKGKPLTDEYFFKLQGMQLKWRRFRQISINDIYRM